jgi:hypothetical protein
VETILVLLLLLLFLGIRRRRTRRRKRRRRLAAVLPAPPFHPTAQRPSGPIHTSPGHRPGFPRADRAV